MSPIRWVQFKWIQFDESNSMSPIRWVHFNESDSISPSQWAQFNESNDFNSMSPTPLVQLNESNSANQVQWVECNDSNSMSRMLWVQFKFNESNLMSPIQWIQFNESNSMSPYIYLFWLLYHSLFTQRSVYMRTAFVGFWFASCLLIDSLWHLFVNVFILSFGYGLLDWMITWLKNQTCNQITDQLAK